jgi:chromate reductase, NAD(P)H dehydrogenase (quinone)
MSNPPKILAFAGSAREASFNKKLVQIAANGARKAGAEVTYIDFRDFPIPLFDQDLEAAEGMPPYAQKLKELFLTHQGLLIASPEYNSTISPLLKNAIDWVSRPAPGEPMLAAFSGKVAGIMSTSPGALGGLRGLAQLREMLGNISIIVLPEQKALPQAFDAFTETGLLKDPAQQESVENIGAKLAQMLIKLQA